MALDAATGAVLWKTLIMNGCCNGQITPIAVADGLVIQGWGQHLFAWDAATGIQRWLVRIASAGNVVSGNRGFGGSGIQVTDGAPAIIGNQVRDNHTVFRPRRDRRRGPLSPPSPVLRCGGT